MTSDMAEDDSILYIYKISIVYHFLLFTSLIFFVDVSFLKVRIDVDITL